MLPGRAWEGYTDTIISYCDMERTDRRTAMAARPKLAAAAPPWPATTGRAFPAGYFSTESVLALVCLAASLLILPLVLPPLPPPPFLLLLVPVGILAVLMVLAFMTSDVRDIASCL